MNRREFVGALGAGAAMAAGEKLKLGLIGCGGYGLADVNAALARAAVHRRVREASSHL